MPVYSEGDLYGMLGTTLQRLQADVTKLDALNMSQGKWRFWRAYQMWDRTETFCAEFQMKNSEWIQMTCTSSESKNYDLLAFEKTTEVHKKSNSMRLDWSRQKKKVSQRQVSCPECRMRSVRR